MGVNAEPHSKPPTRIMRMKQRFSYVWLLFTSVFITRTSALWVHNPTLLLPIGLGATRIRDLPDIETTGRCNNNHIDDGSCSTMKSNNRIDDGGLFFEKLNDWTRKSPLYGNETHPVSSVLSFDVEWLSVFYEFNLTDSGKLETPDPKNTTAVA